MPGDDAKDVTLNTLHGDLREGFADLKGEVQGGFADLQGELREIKVAVVAGVRNLPSREGQEEMVRLLRENNRLQEERFTHLDVRLREQHLEVQGTLRALAEAMGTLAGEVRNVAGEVRNLTGEVRNLTGEVRVMSADIKSLVARIDALIRGRGDGASSP